MGDINWAKLIADIATSEAVMEPVIALMVGYWIRQYNKDRKYRVAGDIVMDIVDYVEEHYREWGIRGSQKMDRFLELFAEEYQQQLGRTPTVKEVQSARVRAEAHVQRARREDRMALSSEECSSHSSRDGLD